MPLFMSLLNTTIKLNHCDVVLYYCYNGNNQDVGGGYAHKWSDWIKFSALAPNTNLINICSDGTYQAKAGERVPVYTYFIRHHLISRIGTVYIDTSEAMQLWALSPTVGTNHWVYDKDNNIFTFPERAPFYFQYVNSGVAKEQQPQYFRQLADMTLTYGDTGNQAYIKNVDYTRKGFNNYFERYVAGDRYYSNLKLTENTFEGTELYTDDLPNYNPLGIESCETVFDRNSALIPRSSDNMAYYASDGDAYNLLGLFGGAVSARLPEGEKYFNPTTIIDEIANKYDISSRFSYYIDENDIKVNLTALADAIVRIGNFNVGDRIQYLSDYGITEILIGAELK